MMAHGCRVKTRIDAAKENVEVRGNHVANCLRSCREELFFGRLPWLRHDQSRMQLYTPSCFGSTKQANNLLNVKSIFSAPALRSLGLCGPSYISVDSWIFYVQKPRSRNDTNQPKHTKATVETQRTQRRRRDFQKTSKCVCCDVLCFDTRSMSVT